MGLEKIPAQPIRHQGTLYSVEKDVSLKAHLTDIDISNGLAWTDDTKTMYYIDSFPRHVYAFDYDIATGEMSKTLFIKTYR